VISFRHFLGLKKLHGSKVEADNSWLLPASDLPMALAYVLGEPRSIVLWRNIFAEVAHDQKILEERLLLELAHEL
jgi:hypothetical protein